jgi:L-rhamnose mutarotase
LGLTHHVSQPVVNESQNSANLNDLALKTARKTVQDDWISKQYRKKTKAQQINYQHKLIWPYIVAVAKKHGLQNNTNIANELKRNDWIGIFDRFDKSYITKWMEMNEYGKRVWNKAVLEQVVVGGRKSRKGQSKILVSFLSCFLLRQENLQLVLS